MRFLLSFSIACLLASCSPNNVTSHEELGRFFKESGTEGCFALLNNADGQFTMYNLGRYRDSAYSPAATFDIVLSLAGLQTGKIVNDSMVINWDGTDRGRPECNANLSMQEAFRRSCPAWFQDLSRRLGRDTLQRWIDSLSYGNRQISRVDTFWLDNTLRIRPDEQMGLVKRLYFNQLPFFKLNQELVKKAMLTEDTPQYRLSYKTGFGRGANGRNLAWAAGWIEENKHPYFFVLNFETEKPESGLSQTTQQLLKNMLKDLGFLEGKK